jgi:hypothetical protein
MDTSEKIAYDFLLHQGFKSVVYEPDGNVPPDFLADGRVAIEVRRLNQNESTGGTNRGLEEMAVPLRRRIDSLLKSLGPPQSSGSWFVSFDFRRPVEKWRILGPAVRKQLEAFRDRPTHECTRIRVSKNFQLELFRATTLHPTFFLLAGWIDYDSGGWVLAEMERNLEICLEEKTRKVSRVRHKYPEWWLVLIDYIDYGLDDFDRQLFRDQVRRVRDWDKVILLDPTKHKEAFEI